MKPILKLWQAKNSEQWAAQKKAEDERDKVPEGSSQWDCLESQWHIIMGYFLWSVGYFKV